MCDGQCLSHLLVSLPNLKKVSIATLALACVFDGTTLASGADDGTVLLWDMSSNIAPQIPNPDFDRDGVVGFADFLLFVAQFGLSRGDEGYDARFDLDGDGVIGFGECQ